MLIPSKKSGYTLLFAVLVATLVLGVAVFITGIARKQYILSSTALDSLYALYAADSGVECATSKGVPSPDNLVSLDCNNQSVSPPSYGNPFPLITSTFSDQGASEPILETNFSFGFYTQAGPLSPIGCAVIKIDSYKKTNGHRHVIIMSRGYNLCKSISGVYEPDDSSSRTVERALQIDYPDVVYSP